MHLNMDKFKKLAEDQKSATFLHPDGHKITVAKHVLSAGMRGQLSKMPIHYDEGTKDAPVPDPVDEAMTPASDPNASYQPPADTAPPNYVQNGTFDTNKFIMDNPDAPLSSKMGVIQQQEESKDLQDKAMSEKEGEIQQYNKMAARNNLPLQPDVIPQDNTEPNVPPKNPNPQGYTLGNYAGLLNQGYNQQMGGIQGEANALGAQGSAQAPIFAQGAKAQQQIMDNAQAQQQHIGNEMDAVAQEVHDKHIDPNQVFHNMGIGSKILALVGVALGGQGSVDIINRQIDRDIQAQEFDIGKNENLLSHYTQQFGNVTQATQMLRGIQSDIIGNQIAEQAAKFQNPIMQAKAAQLIGQLKQQKGQMQMQLGMQAGLASGQLPAQMQGFLPPQLQEKTVKLPSGNLGMASSKEDAGKVKEAFESYGNIENQLNDIEATMAQKGRAINPLGSYAAESTSMKNSLTGELNKLHGLNRLNDNELQMWKQESPGPGDLREGVVNAKIQTLRKLIAGKKAAEMNNYLVGPNQAPNSMQTQPPNIPGAR